ncbi:DUF7933 domain-containing protein [Actinokineospora diospyrosa]|uniref:DUF7933 domain-containing protein n=1 Tax=Actinokineospora diospyrosa TaxID=103728 RepID=A0ABT1INI4_9PSEU|nr:hypothetical protein [Actinokineospora diospyrosa]MCP2274227.1 hypothetical protein [Actinokineospora diospyrosa]
MFAPRRVLLPVVLAGACLCSASPAQAAPQPRLSAAYSVSASAVNATRALVFTVYNSDILTTVGFSFTLNLPAGITRPVTAPSSTCTDTTVSDTPPDPGGIIPPFRSAQADTLYIDGILSNVALSCTITIPVTAAAQGTYTTCPGAIVDLVGTTTLDSCAPIYFEEPYAYRED